MEDFNISLLVSDASLRLKINKNLGSLDNITIIPKKVGEREFLKIKSKMTE